MDYFELDLAEVQSVLKKRRDKKSLTYDSTFFMVSPCMRFAFEISIYHDDNFCHPPIVHIDYLKGFNEIKMIGGVEKPFINEINSQIKEYLKRKRFEKNSVLTNIITYCSELIQNYILSSHAVQWFVLPSFDWSPIYKTAIHAPDANELYHDFKKLLDFTSENSLFRYTLKELEFSADRKAFKKACASIPIITAIPETTSVEFSCLTIRNKKFERCTYSELVYLQEVRGAIGIDVSEKNNDLDVVKNRKYLISIL